MRDYQVELINDGVIVILVIEEKNIKLIIYCLAIES